MAGIKFSIIISLLITGIIISISAFVLPKAGGLEEIKTLRYKDGNLVLNSYYRQGNMVLYFGADVTVKKPENSILPEKSAGTSVGLFNLLRKKRSPSTYSDCVGDCSKDKSPSKMVCTERGQVFPKRCYFDCEVERDGKVTEVPCKHW